MIVVAHPDAEVRGALEALLRADGHRTVGAASIAAARRALASPIDAMIAALELSGRPAGGLELLARTRELQPGAARALITLAPGSVAENAFVAGLAHRVWTVPIDEHSLRTWFGRTLGHHARRSVPSR